MPKSTLYPKSAKDIKGKTAIAELIRAHLIITLLSFSIVPVLVLSSLQPIRYDARLITAAVALLLLLGCASAGTIFALRKQK